MSELLCRDGLRRQIFMGAGDHSLAQCGRLYQLIGRAIDILGATQQPPTCHEPAEVFDEHCRRAEDARFDVKNIVREIALGLTGQKIRFLDEERAEELKATVKKGFFDDDD